ncbi:MAG: alpha/beta hydrolase [Alphaproteobacteria bacterium]
MVDIIISGECGKLHAVYHKSELQGGPLAVVLSGNPRQKCHMNDRISYAMFKAFMDAGFSVVRFNYRGVNDSDGAIGTTSENMLDIATVIDWIQNKNEDSSCIWLAGNQLGAWYVLQAMMRRPEISGFALVSPDPSVNDFTFLSPRPNNGLLLQGAEESEDARNFSVHLTQILKKQAQISLETIRIKNSDSTYSNPGDLRRMYNELKAYIGRENLDVRQKNLDIK